MNIGHTRIIIIREIRARGAVAVQEVEVCGVELVSPPFLPATILQLLTGIQSPLHGCHALLHSVCSCANIEGEMGDITSTIHFTLVYAVCKCDITHCLHNLIIFDTTYSHPLTTTC